MVNNVLQRNPAYAAELGAKRKGNCNNYTLIKKSLNPRSLQDLSDQVKHVWMELLQHEDIEYRIIAAREISKYIFPVMRQIEANVTISIEDILDEADEMDDLDNLKEIPADE